MDKIDCKKASNSELRLYQETLKNEYEVIKQQIQDMFKKLDELDVEYNKVENELNNRRNMRY